MSINLSFVDFVVPISLIEKKYPDGLPRCLYDHRRSLGGVAYFDQHLFHLGSMSEEGIESLIQKWTALGFESTGVVDGKECWKDVCALESLLQRTAQPCHWLMVDANERTGYLAGTDSGAVVGRRLFYERRKTKAAKWRYKWDRVKMRWTAVLIYRLRNLSPALVRWLTLLLIRQMEWEPATSP